MRECLTAQLQPEDAEDPETNSSVPQQEEQPVATEDIDLEVAYEGSEPENVSDAQEEKEKNSDTKYSNMEIPHDQTFCQWMMHCNVLQKIQHVHQEQGPEIMTLWLQDMYIWLEFSPKAAKLLIKKQGLDSHERLRVLIDKKVNYICNLVRNPGGKNADRMPNREQQVSVIAQET